MTIPALDTAGQDMVIREGATELDVVEARGSPPFSCGY